MGIVALRDRPWWAWALLAVVVYAVFWVLNRAGAGLRKAADDEKASGGKFLAAVFWILFVAFWAMVVYVNVVT